MNTSVDIPDLGVGLGLRRAHFDALLNDLPPEIEWFEVAPENYMDIGGRLYKDFCELASKRPVRTHSVAMSLGSLDPLNRIFLKQLKEFIRKHKVPFHSDHICFSSFKGVQFDDLLPLPFTWEAVKHIAKRIRQAQDILEVPLAVENASYYCPSGAAEMTEPEFISAVLEEADCGLLLDVNNIYVNSINHRFDPENFLQQMPLDRIVYVHIAGHYQKRSNFILDTHGAEIIDPVWKILDRLCQLKPQASVIIERDNNIPPLEELRPELEMAHRLVRQYNKRVKNTVIASPKGVAISQQNLGSRDHRVVSQECNDKLRLEA
jgi:uncharacterized protein